MQRKLFSQQNLSALSPHGSRPVRSARKPSSPSRNLHSVLGGSALLAFSLLLYLSRSATLRQVAPLALVAGVAVLGREGWLLWDLNRRQQAVAQARKRREALRVARKERTAQQRERRRLQRAAQQAARTRLMETRAAQKQAEQSLQQEQAMRRALQATAIEAEAHRLATLSDSQLFAYIRTLFTDRGLTPYPFAADAEFDLLLTDPTSAIAAVARCVPQERRATATDVEMLEAWRQETKAPHAYLVALTGFSPEAVATVQNQPITLVEAYLLAQWNTKRSLECTPS